jgi:hypothetical protein
MVEVYAGLDVSDKSTHVCVMDGSGAVVWAGTCATYLEAIARNYDEELRITNYGLTVTAHSIARAHSRNDPQSPSPPLQIVGNKSSRSRWPADMPWPG